MAGVGERICGTTRPRTSRGVDDHVQHVVAASRECAAEPPFVSHRTIRLLPTVGSTATCRRGAGHVRHAPARHAPARQAPARWSDHIRRDLAVADDQFALAAADRPDGRLSGLTSVGVAIEGVTICAGFRPLTFAMC